MPSTTDSCCGCSCDPFVKDLGDISGNESASIELYVVLGGTNFGFNDSALARQDDGVHDYLSLLCTD